MKKFEIIDLYLEGFAKIHTGMHIDRLYLNFAEMPHQTYLFVGDSGSGKSSVLKSIHPFAFNNGTGDESASSDLIMSGRNGKKTIRYHMDNMIITCNHLYTRKPDESLQVKSFFSVNEEELNPSGLVTTFKELVMQYFYIDESFLALLALGNSVRSMVEYTAGERKKFAVRIFTELNVFMTYYKNASATVRELDTILSNVVDKLGRYGSYDKKDIQREIKSLNVIIAELEKQLSDVLKDEGVIRNKLDTNQAAYQEYETCQGQITNLLRQIEALKTKRKTTSDVVVLENEQHQIEKNIITTELRIESLESTIKSELEFKEMKLASKKNLESSIEKLEQGTNKVELEKLRANIDAELEGLTEVEVLDDVDYRKKKDDLVMANVYLDELRGMCTDLVSEVRMHDLIGQVLNGFLRNKRFEQELDIAYKAALERVINLENANQLSGKIKIPKIRQVSCEDMDCPYRKFYNDSLEILTSERDKASKVLRVAEDGMRVAEDKIAIATIIKKLYRYIDKHDEYFGIVPKEIFDPTMFIERFMSNSDRQIYDYGLMSSTISYLEQAVRKSELLTLRKTTVDQITGLDTTISLCESMKADLERITRELIEVDEVVSHHQTDLEYNQTQLNEFNDTAKKLSVEIEVAKDLEACRNVLQDTRKQLNSMEACKKQFDNLSLQLTRIQSNTGEIRTKLDENRKRINQLNNTLETIQSLEREQEMLSARYNEAVLIRDAVSPSKGIPVEFIDDVIRNQMIDSINELMHVAYPDITLIKDKDKLVINEKEFTIPYKKNGVIIGDISEASDGERAMLSLAFSLVLIRLVSKVYNIMLLDEMDTTLDKYGRSKYIDIIEQYMTTISATQIFLISHNSMFDMYNVNVLLTTKSTMQNTEERYVVAVYEQNFTPDISA